MFDFILPLELKILVLLGALSMGFFVSRAIKKMPRASAWWVVVISLVGCLVGNLVFSAIFGTIHTSLGAALSFYALSLTAFYVWRLIHE